MSFAVNLENRSEMIKSNLTENEQKEKIKEYKHHHYLIHKDEYKERNRKWMVEHREKMREAQRKYYKSNAKKLNVKSRAWYEKHKEKEHERRHQRYLLRCNIEKEYNKLWKATHPENRIVSEHKRRFQKYGNGGSFTVEEFQEICEKFGNRCLRCGEKNLTLTIDHIIPLSKGGINDIDNIQPLCRSCNAMKYNKIFDYREVQNGMSV